MRAVIHYTRINRPVTIYEEGFVRDDGARVDTRTVLPPEFSHVWRSIIEQVTGTQNGRPTVHTVCKHLFYHEWFDIIELLDDSGRLIGCYCDVVTPLQKIGGAYYLRDLLLDLWVWPDGRCQELDWPEFEAARAQGLLTPEEQSQAVATLRRMVDEANAGVFPWRYLG
jgi:predicted RNA-binding protein associated with RNAse of E/G family